MKCVTQYTAVAVSVLSLIACSSGSSDQPIGVDPPAPVFTYRGLGGLTVIDFAETDTGVLAATDRGIYRYDGQSDWTRLTPEEWSVLAMEALYPSHLLASVELSVQERYLVESLNGGDEWRMVEYDFGAGANLEPAEPILRLLFNENTGELFATGYGVLALSEDFGRTWSPLDGQWGQIATGLSALSFASDREDFWYGGQGALEDPVLRRFSPASGETFDHSSEVEATLGRPSTVKNVRFYPSNDDTLFVMGEGGIMSSSDYGSTWAPTLVNDTSRFYFDLVIDDRTGVAYTGGWDKNFTDPQPLLLEVSTDSGLTWTTHEHTDPDLLGGVWSMSLLDLDGDRRLFVGLQGGGVYEVDLDAID